MTSEQLMPERLGDYLLLNRIGEGGMGVVYRAQDATDRTVALKVLRDTVAGEPVARRRLAREVETMQLVKSPYVAEVIDADIHSGTPYIVTRYVPGQTLDEVVNAHGPLTGAVLARVAFGLAEALAAVHAAGVVHRDLKPGNVMMLDGSPVVIDFGIAQGADATRLTLTGMFMGTPGYLAPEVIEGNPSSEASDVHAWGATVAFAATGRPPYGKGSYESIFYRIVNGQADLSGCPEPLVPLLSAALSRDPGQRPPAVRLGARAAALDSAALVPGPAAAMAPPAGGGGAYPTRADAAGGRAVPPGVPVTGASLADAAPAAAGSGAAFPAAASAALSSEACPAQSLAGNGAAGAREPGNGPHVDGARVDGAYVDGAYVDGAQRNGTRSDSAQSGGAYGDGVAAGMLLAGGDRGPGAPTPATNGYSPTSVMPPGTRPLPVGAPSRAELSDMLPPVRYAVHGAREGTPGHGPRQSASGRPATRGDASRPVSRPHGLWALVGATVVALASVSVLLPVTGTAAALAVLTLLRAAGLAQRRSAVRRAAHGTRASDVVVVTVTFPLQVLRSLLALVMLAPFGLAAAAVAAGVTVAFVPGDWPQRALAYAAGAGVLFYGLGPGSGTARSQLGRVFGAVTRRPATQAVALAGVGVLAVAALSAALSWPSFYWPVHTGNWFGVGTLHFGPLRNLGLLRHVSVLHRIRMLGHALRHHFGR